MFCNDEIETDRLVVRYFKESDWLDLYEYLSKEEVVKFEPYNIYSKEESKKEAINRSKSNEFFAVCLKSEQKVIGNIYFGKRDFETYEIGYVFNSKYWGNGYATEAAKEILEYSFTSGEVRRVIAECNPLNKASWKLMERLNMRREGHLLKNIYFNKDENNNPIWQDTYLYGILKEEWKY